MHISVMCQHRVEQGLMCNLNAKQLANNNNQQQIPVRQLCTEQNLTSSTNLDKYSHLVKGKGFRALFTGM